MWNPSVPHQNSPRALKAKLIHYGVCSLPIYMLDGAGFLTELKLNGASVDQARRSREFNGTLIGHFHSSLDEEVFVADEPGSALSSADFAHHLQTVSKLSCRGNAEPAKV